MKKRIFLAVMVCVMLTVSAMAEERTVSVERADGASREAAVSIPGGGALWCAAYDSAGRMLEAFPVDGDAVRVGEDAEQVRLMALGTDLVPLGRVRVRLDDVSWEELCQEGADALASGDWIQALTSFLSAVAEAPDQPRPYVGRGDAYIGLGETAEHLAAARSDYETANGLDPTYVQAWLGLADVAIRQGGYDRAEEILERAVEATGNDPAVADKLAEVKSGNVHDSSGHVRRESNYDADGVLQWRHDFTYDAQGRQASVTAYDGDGNELNRVDLEYDAQGRMVTSYGYNTDDGILIRFSNEYTEAGDRSRSTEQVYRDGEWVTTHFTLYQYDSARRNTRWDMYSVRDGEETFMYYRIMEYDTEGRSIRDTDYDADGTMRGYYTFSYDEAGRRIRYDHYSRTWSDGGYTGDPVLAWYELSFYNEAGDLIRTERYDGDGNLTSTTEYTR